MKRAFLTPLVLALIIVALSASIADAHPHVWVTVQSEIMLDAARRLKGIQHTWTFDQAYSAYVVQGVDREADGSIKADKLKETAQQNIEGLKEFNYFTMVRINGALVPFDPVDHYKLEFQGDRLILSFYLALKDDANAEANAADIKINDPSFFGSLTVSGAEDAISLKNAPDGCHAKITRPESLEDAKRQLPESFYASLDPSANYGAQFANEVSIACQ